MSTKVFQIICHKKDLVPVNTELPKFLQFGREGASRLNDGYTSLEEALKVADNGNKKDGTYFYTVVRLLASPIKPSKSQYPNLERYP